jgi:hypothetical protein
MFPCCEKRVHKSVNVARMRAYANVGGDARTPPGTSNLGVSTMYMKNKRLSRHVWTLTLSVSFLLLIILIIALILAH